ncbi:hypothetical protein [Maridesulfovibrio hydrothermalis]|uniref:Uncharacterized protein n=1 Tax=Maridesulfovibrio hydrothermalis AM13 = DSM 14728 TaxID=1121451 RepID=L0R9E3_9BACT|nr:hypothetical protein [Maridesulfovibrio hydrothermalis]CCO22206.1 protein of unknown function [Maridesulfovibrio hydrothermalis AM13 = DSM 14728]
MSETGRKTDNSPFQLKRMGPQSQKVTDSLIDALAHLERGSIEDLRKAKNLPEIRSKRGAAAW